MTYDFKNQLNKGLSGENLIETYYEGILQPKPRGDMGPDFAIVNPETGETEGYFELKTEQYSDGNRYNKAKKITTNFFIEYYSTDTKKNPGGPWQAMEKGCTHYAHLFQTGNLYIFRDIALLAHYLDNYVAMNNLKLQKIPNKNYNTEGYLIPIKDLKDYYTKINIRGKDA